MRVIRSKLLTVGALLAGLGQTALRRTRESRTRPSRRTRGWAAAGHGSSHSPITSTGRDFNLRWQRSDTHAWLGAYTDRVFGSQGRAGVDTSVDLGHSVQLQPSLQVATEGFLGGSLNVQAGESWFALAGIGRTNLKPYFNLNFDPNDALTFAAGHHTADGSVYTLFVVADDRLHTHQRDWHFNVRIPVSDMRAWASPRASDRRAHVCWAVRRAPAAALDQVTSAPWARAQERPLSASDQNVRAQ